MKIKIDRDNMLLVVPLTGFALGTLYVGSSYGPVSAFIPFWASIFMLLTCLFVLAGLDKQADNDEGDDTKAKRPDIQSVLSAACLDHSLCSHSLLYRTDPCRSRLYVLLYVFVRWEKAVDGDRSQRRVRSDLVWSL